MATQGESAQLDKVRDRLRQLRHVGTLTHEDATSRDMVLIETAHGAEQALDHIVLTLLVDRAGIIREVRFRSQAVGAQLAAYDVMAELCVGRTLASAATITPAAADRLLRDQDDRPVLPLEDAERPFYVLVKAYERGHTTDQPAQDAGSPGSASTLGWTDVGLFEKVRRIEGVLDVHVRPALSSDGGGIDLVDLRGDDLVVQYHGACGSCSSSIGGTLQFIQDSLNNHLGTTLQVVVSGMDEDGPMIPV